LNRGFYNGVAQQVQVTKEFVIQKIKGGGRCFGQSMEYLLLIPFYKYLLGDGERGTAGKLGLILDRYIFPNMKA
jgi:hypothetical protein